MKLKVLELFSGTECISNAFRARGHECFTVDWDERFNSSWHTDIETVTAQDIIDRFGHPDVIWVGTDCTSYSVAAISHHRRKNPVTGNLDPVTEYAKKSDRMNQHVKELIRELSPKYYFWENPRGGLRKMVWMQDLPRYTICYCKYETDRVPEQRRMKPTDIWTNHPDPRFKPMCYNGNPDHAAAPRGARTGTQGMKNATERSTYPKLLCEHIVDICEINTIESEDEKMAQKVLIMGESGTGKSTSLRNLDPAITAIVNPVGKPLPFKTGGKKFTMLNNETKASNIISWMRGKAKEGKKIIVVDDFQYLLSIPYMNRIHEGGWDKWNDFGDDYFKLIDVCAELPADVRVYYLSHSETLENGVTTIKLIGKLLREKITIEGLFTIVLKTAVIDQTYYFLTQNSGKDTVKSPMGMFPDYSVENDLAYIDDKICNYYEIGDFKTDEEMAAEDQKVAGDIARPDKNGRRPRGTTAAPAKERKTRDQVVAENKAKVDQYMADCDKAVAAIADGREEIPFDEATAATEAVPMPELETPPRRTRAERQAEKTEKVSDQFMNVPESADDEELPFGNEEKKPRERKARNIQPEGDTGTQGTDEDFPEPQATAGPQDASARSRRVRRTRG